MLVFISSLVNAASGKDIARQHFLSTLTLALTDWKAKGMTLRRVRFCVRRSVMSTPGVGYVAVTRVEHVEHFVFEEDMSPWVSFGGLR